VSIFKQCRVCVSRVSIFSTLYNVEKLLKLFLCSDSRLILRSTGSVQPKVGCHWPLDGK